MSQASNHKLLQKLTGYIDGWIVPIAFGTFSVLVVAQFLTSFGPVRTYVDRIEGRFMEQPAAVIPTSVNKESATLTLYLSPATPRPDITVTLNGKPLLKFTTTSLTLVVHEGDKLQIQSSGKGTAYISIDDDNPDLFLPAPGQTFKVSGDQPEVILPVVSFTH